jgi:hypothetical protein
LQILRVRRAAFDALSGSGSRLKLGPLPSSELGFGAGGDRSGGFLEVVEGGKVDLVADSREELRRAGWGACIVGIFVSTRRLAKGERHIELREANETTEMVSLLFGS